MMLGNQQKRTIIDGVCHAIKKIREDKITEKEHIDYIVQTAFSLRKKSIISDYDEIGTSYEELVSFMNL